MYPTLTMYIDGEFIGADGRDSAELRNPANGERLGALPHASTADLDRALAAAAVGFRLWRATSAYDRAKVMRQAAQLIRDRADAIARILTQEQGKVLAEAKGEVVTAADVIEWYAEEGRRAYGRVIPGRAPNTRMLVLQEPIGPVAAFTPWNFPAVTPARKIGGAIGAGCSIIIKAAEETPGTCLELVRAFHDAGLPKGVLNLVFGVPAKISEQLIASPVIRKVSFTGSTAVGKTLMKLAAEGVKATTMELGGHAPVVVFADSDAEAAGQAAAAAKFRNAGQVCVAPSRFYVQAPIHDRFAEAFAQAAKALQLGDGLDAASTMGPLANLRRLEQMDRLVADARDRGAKILAGGERGSNAGHFFQPTVLSGLEPDAAVLNEEPFGPVAPIVPFDSFDEVVERANALPFGLAAYAFTRDNRQATAIADALEAGVVGINTFAIATPETPFGGIKASGHGREGGIEGLEAYTTRKFVAEH